MSSWKKNTMYVVILNRGPWFLTSIHSNMFSLRKIKGEIFIRYSLYSELRMSDQCPVITSRIKDTPLTLNIHRPWCCTILIPKVEQVNLTILWMVWKVCSEWHTLQSPCLILFSTVGCEKCMYVWPNIYILFNKLSVIFIQQTHTHTRQNLVQFKFHNTVINSCLKVILILKVNVDPCPAEYIKMPHPVLVFSQLNYLIQIVDINCILNGKQCRSRMVGFFKPTDLDLHCLQRQDMFGFSRTRVKLHYMLICFSHLCWTYLFLS